MSASSGHMLPLDPDDPYPRSRVRRIAGRDIVFDEEGFFVDPNDWSEEAADILARESGLDAVTDSHWRVLFFLREYYFSNGRAPLNRQLKTGLGMSLMALESLFPCGIKKGAKRLAGLPNPQSCM
jgi:dissimilatory sulfite reductase related protein